MSAAALRLAAGHFFGGARRAWTSHGIDVSHRIAEGPAEAVLTHTHEDAHFILVTGGDYVSAAEGRRAASQPVLIYNPPGTTHRDHFERGRGSFFAISLRPDQAARVLPGGCVPDSPRYLVAPAQYSLAARIGSCCATDAEGLSVEALCLELLGSMESRGASRLPPPWLHATLELLADRYAEDLSVADIAAGVGVHPIHLARTFRRHFRCTPGEFARYRRLERAAGMLVRSRQPLSEVALSSGFADQSHFSRSFARQFGLPPGEYRLLAGEGTGGARRFQIDKTRFAPSHKVPAWTAAGAAARRRV